MLFRGIVGVCKNVIKHIHRQCEGGAAIFNIISDNRSFYQQIGLKFEEETSEMLYLEHGFLWC
jgi:hypothetical protein